MTRRLARSAVAAAFVAAAAPAVAAAPVAARTAAAAGAAPAASGSICVAVVVDATHAGGGVQADCARVPAGSSGSDVLQAAGHRVEFDPRYGDDFVCAIDGVPSGGCHAVDGTHYWAYYHRAPGSSTWRTSSEGAGTYQPRNASTEGWVYDNGSSSPPAPRSVPYSTICPKASPTPTPTSTTHSSTASHVTATASPVLSASPAASPAGATPTAATKAATAAATRQARAAARTTLAVPADPSATAPTPARPSASLAARSRGSGDGGSGVAGVAAGAALVVLVGAGALWRARRRGRA